MLSVVGHRDHEFLQVAFLGFDFRWTRSDKTGAMYARRSPRPKKVTQVLRAVHDVLRTARALPVRVAVKRVNEIVRGWVNYFRVGNASRAFGKVHYRAQPLECRLMTSRTLHPTGSDTLAAQRRRDVRADGGRRIAAQGHAHMQRTPTTSRPQRRGARALWRR
jgi:hypothetical protein